MNIYIVLWPMDELALWRCNASNYQCAIIIVIQESLRLR